MKVTAILKGMIDKNGHQPVQIRIADSGKRWFKPTGIKVDPELFKNGKIDKKHPKAADYNKTLEILIIQYQAQALNGFEKKHEPLSLYDYIGKTIEHLTRNDETVRQYRTQINKLKRFRTEIYLTDLNHDFFNQYKAHLRKIGNSGNTIWSGFKFLKTFTSKAVDERLLKEDPFKNWEFPKYVDPYRNYLTEAEVKKIDKFCNSKACTPALFEVGTWFLIGCYTGLRISDIKAFDKKKNIIGGRLVMKTQKTGEIVGLPVSAKLKAYFERVDYKLSMHQNTYNKLLKVLAGAVGLDKNVHAHLSRHTAAMMLANAGVSQEVTGKILGHMNLKSTSTYYKISNKRIDTELKKVR